MGADVVFTGNSCPRSTNWFVMTRWRSLSGTLLSRGMERDASGPNGLLPSPKALAEGGGQMLVLGVKQPGPLWCDDASKLWVQEWGPRIAA